MYILDNISLSIGTHKRNRRANMTTIHTIASRAMILKYLAEMPNNQGTGRQIADYAMENYPDLLARKIASYVGKVDNPEKTAKDAVYWEVSSRLSEANRHEFNDAIGKLDEREGRSFVYYLVDHLAFANCTPTEDEVEDTDTPVDTADEVEKKQTRAQIEAEGIASLDEDDQDRYSMFFKVIGPKLSAMAGVYSFDVDHANSIHEHGIKAITPDNLQILERGLNRSKNSDSAKRMSWAQQEYHIRQIIGMGRMFDPLTDSETKKLERVLRMLKLVYTA